ncbi:exocyst complex component exo84 [Recurvomyces mirabilis]|nr:exocyst complex component exo84 [Recurvomyces mirabilis]
MSDEKGSKGISLRRKKTTARPTISAPRQIGAPQQQQRRDASADSRNPSTWDTQSTHSAQTGLSVPTPGRPSISGDKTSDLVKRRYSTRFAGGQPQYGVNGGDGGLVPSVPSVPNIPSQYKQQGQGRPSQDSRSPSRDGRSPEHGRGPLRVDARALKDPNLQAEKYVQSILAEATESDIHNYKNDLQNIKLSTSTDLKHNVYQNRTQFIKISKEADKLKSEMRSLRALMGELTGALGHATSAGGIDELGAPGSRLSMLGSVADRKRANRSSVANLEAMWSTHLQTLWKRVEGSQKYLPALPGRHIIMESQRWIELNSATWKPRRRVALVLLNDHLLVASEKKKQVEAQAGGNRNSVYGSAPATGQTQTMLIAERCWPLQDVSLVDISSPSNAGHTNSREHKTIQNAINIRAGTESFTYATTDGAEKAGILVAFRKAQEDQRKLMAAEHGQREKKLDEMTLLTGRDPRLLKKAAAEQAEAEKASGISRSNSVLIDVEGRQQNIRWVESQLDGLDIDIALQRFEEAVGRVEKLWQMARGIKGNVTAQEIIQSKVDSRAGKLAGLVARQLSQGSCGLEGVKGMAGWLGRLGYEEMARTKYLDSRTETMRARTRQLPFTGELQPYLHALSYTTFTLLLHTFRTFSAAFPPPAGSAVVKWAKERVDEFNGALARQMETVRKNSQVWNECVGTVREQAAVLGEVGVDFMAFVGKGLWEEGSVGSGAQSAGGGTGRKGVTLSDDGPVGLGVST